MLNKFAIFSIVLLFFLQLYSCAVKTQKNIKTDSLVAKHGLLRVDGIRIVDKKNQQISLAGNSFFWSNPYWRGVKFFTKDAVKWLHKDWHTQIIRVPLAADPRVKDGYLYEPDVNLKAVERLVDTAIEEGIYVIIDWHSQHAEQNEAQAIEFFEKMARKYGKYPNVMYEIYNEPLKVSWDTVVKPYAEHVISAIRKIDPDNMIIVGTPNWSQDVDVASENPITGYNNIAYTLHFYAASHFEWLHNKMEKAIKNGLPLFVTEWGTVKANGDGQMHLESVKKWMQLLKKYKLSHCNWSVNDKTEGASILKPGASVHGGWSEDDLSPSGKLVREYIRNWQTFVNEK